jgi:hypothetical protein
MRIPNNSFIHEAFVLGQGVELQLDPAERDAMHADLTNLGDQILQIPQELSFAWTAEKPTRHSYWLASKASGDFITEEEELKKFDGGFDAGQRGLTSLGEIALLEPLNNLKQRADIAIKAAALAIGIPDTFLKLCSTRYRVIHYEGKDNGGIGTHFDGNGISVVQTNSPGLIELGYNGTVKSVDKDSVSIMPGSTIYRGTTHRKRPFLPTFHGVRLASTEQKTTMAAFWNLPTPAVIPDTVLGKK